MKKYFHVDHTTRTFVTAYPNLVMKSQRYAKSCDFQETKNHKMKCYRGMFVDVLKLFSGKMEERQSTSYLTTEIRHFFPTFVVLKL